MKELLFTVLTAFSSNPQIKVAVIDTGINVASVPEAPLCKTGHAHVDTVVRITKDPPKDSGDGNNHGTNIASIISQNVGSAYKKEYCLVIIRYNLDADGKTSAMAIRHAISEGVDFINYSGGGVERYQDEDSAVSDAISRGIVFVAAAGNNYKKLSNELGKDNTTYYPAMSHPEVTVVGATRDGKRMVSSNYGDIVDIWEEGYLVSGGGTMSSGTSQAAAKATGKLLRVMIQTKIGERSQ